MPNLPELQIVPRVVKEYDEEINNGFERSRMFLLMVGARGFEPPTSRSRTERSTRLSHAPPTKV